MYNIRLIFYFRSLSMQYYMTFKVKSGNTVCILVPYYATAPLALRIKRLVWTFSLFPIPFSSDWPSVQLT